MATQSAALPPDVLFAQKASAVVKAAGLDPRAMDLEKFRQMAPIVFARAYEAIYNETVVENSNATYVHEQSSNSQIIIDSLIRKTGNPALSGLKGKDVCEGSHRAIGVLVGVLFAEGQRLWLEKLQKGGTDKKKKKVKKAIKKEVDDNVTQSILPSSSDDPSTRMLKRITHIKHQLASNDDAFVKEQSNNIITTEELILKSKKKRTKKAHKEPQTDYNEIENYPEPIKVHRPRPTSAPQTRKPLHPQPVKIPDRVEVTNNTRPQSPERKKVDNNAVQPYTYDLKSGRKIWLTQDQIDSIDLQRKRAMLGNIHALPDEELENNDADADGDKPKSPKRPASAGLYRRDERPVSPPARTEPFWPGQSTEKSVEEWLRKMRRDRFLHDENNKANPANVNPDLLRPRFFQSYNKMQMRDIVISIEHCHSCKAHNSTLRHDEASYESQANAMLRNLAHAVHSCCVAVRVGVVRFKANITSKCKHSDSNTRIGAFEVQIAYRSPSGQIHPELLHSKLLSRNWPSKSVLEKRLKSYLSKLQIPTFAYDETIDYDGQDNEGIESYPVGAGSWSSTPLADPMWCYIPPAAATPKTTDKSEEDHENNDSSKALQFIQWVYDSRKQSTLPKFSLGTTVSVSSITHPRGGSERHALIGVVKAYPSNNDMPLQTMVVVRLKYHSSEITVPLNACDYLTETLERYESIPTELEGLIILAKSVLLSSETKAISWRIMDSEDKNEKNGIHLGRNSYFHQIRNLVWDLESSLLKNANNNSIKHPKTGKSIDLQLAYSESQIDWVFSRFGKLANMTELEDIAVNGEKKVEPEAEHFSEQIDVPTLDLAAVAENNKITSRASALEKEVKPESARPESAKPESARPEAAKPLSARPEAARPESTRPDAARPLSARPESARPEAARPESARPEAARPESTRPEAARPLSARPESARPEAARPESARPEAAKPESARSESPRAKETTSPRKTNENGSKPNSAPTSVRKEESSVNYENGDDFEDYGDDFDEPEDKNATEAMKDTLNDRYAALMNEDDNDDDIDYNDL